MTEHTLLTLGAATIHGGRPALGPDGTGYFFTGLSGWDDPPALRFEAIERTGSHGSTAGRGYLSERTVVIDGYVICPAGDPVKLREAVDHLVAQLPVAGDAPLVVAEPGLTRHLMVRQGGQPVVDRIGRQTGRHLVAGFSLQLAAMDPRRLSGDGAPTITVPLPTDGTPAVLSTGGRIEAPARVEITGPATGTTTLACAGRTLTVQAEVPAGATLVLDLERRRASMGGTDLGAETTGLWPAPTAGDRTFTLTTTAAAAAIQAWEAWA